MNWLHCNKCGVIKTSRSTIQFFCGSCSHVLCSTCNRLQSQTCPIDKRPFNAVKISQSMPGKLRLYFDDPNKLLTPWQKCIRFQFEQRAQCELMLFSGNLKQMRQFRNEIKLLVKAKQILVESVGKDIKRNNKMKAYLKNCYQNRDRSMSVSRASTSDGSLNFSYLQGESGVDLQFDGLSISD